MEEEFLIGSTTGELMIMASGYDGEEARQLIAIANEADEVLHVFGIDTIEYAGEALYTDTSWATELIEDYRTSPEVVAFQLMGGQTAETRSRTSETDKIENQREKIKTGEIFL